MKKAIGRQAFTSPEAEMSNSQTSLQVKIYKDGSLKSYQIKTKHKKKYKKKNESVEKQRTHTATLSLRRESGDWVALKNINRGSTQKNVFLYK